MKKLLKVSAIGCLGLVGLFILLAVVGTMLGGDDAEAPATPEQAAVEIAPTDKPTARTVAGEWYQGGTLHVATVADWKTGSADDKLATAADWLAATAWKGHLNDSTDFDRMRNKAQMLANGVDEVVPASPDTMKVSEIAAALVAMSDEFGP